MAECEHLARTSAYYDGALAVADEAAAADHIATCAECQALLGDAVGIDAALADAKPAVRRRRWPVIVGFVAVAASVVLWFALRRRETPADVVAIELPKERAVEARFTGARFASHRSLAVLRGDKPREQIPLATMAALEKAGAQHDLLAALAAAGDTARAAELADKLPSTPDGDADRAAVALAAGDPERALRFAWRAIDKAPDLVAAQWNVALAARALQLPRVARAHFERVAKAGEPGWADEATRAIAAIELDDDRATEIDRRGKAMIAGGAVLSADDVARAPSQARIDFFDAVRVAPDKARLEALRPLATAIDERAVAFLDRANASVGAKYGAAYRALVERTATPDDTTKLLDALRADKRAGYVYVGAVVLANQARARWQELQKITAAWNDPWFSLAIERERLFATLPENDPRLEPALAALLATCRSDAWAMRCGQLALDLATVMQANGRDERAVPLAQQAVEHFARGGKPALRVRAQSFVAELHRRLGRTALARTELAEVVLASPASCDNRRYARIGQVQIAMLDGDWAAARAQLPAADEAGCTQVHDVLGIAMAVDLARASGDAHDLTVARAWLAQANDDFAKIGAARLLRGAPEATAAIEAWFRDTAAAPATPLREVARAWAYATLIADAGARSGWDEALAFAERESPSLRTAECSVVASTDEATLTVVVKTPRALSGAHRTIVLAELATTAIVPPDLVAQLAGCKDIAVVAPPPLHGRADVLPVELPWAFASARPVATPPAGARRAVVVGDARPPDPTLPRLTAPPTTGFDVAIVGPEATPRRVLAALGDATYAELHVHGVVDAEGDAAHLALSPDPGGAFALRADVVRTAKLSRAPIVVLGACRAANVAPYWRARWSLPDAFVTAGARAVVAADTPIEDASAQAVFSELRRRVDAGEAVTTVVAAIRASTPQAGWARRLIVFR